MASVSIAARGRRRGASTTRVMAGARSGAVRNAKPPATSTSGAGRAAVAAASAVSTARASQPGGRAPPGGRVSPGGRTRRPAPRRCGAHGRRARVGLGEWGGGVVLAGVGGVGCRDASCRCWRRPRRLAGQRRPRRRCPAQGPPPARPAASACGWPSIPGAGASTGAAAALARRSRGVVGAVIDVGLRGGLVRGVDAGARAAVGASAPSPAWVCGAASSAPSVSGAGVSVRASAVSRLAVVWIAPSVSVACTVVSASNAGKSVSIASSTASVSVPSLRPRVLRVTGVEHCAVGRQAARASGTSGRDAARRGRTRMGPKSRS